MGAGSFLPLIAFVHGSRTNAPWAKNLKAFKCINADFFQAINSFVDMLQTGERNARRARAHPETWRIPKAKAKGVSINSLEKSLFWHSRTF
jgi:hypothetical protein